MAQDVIWQNASEEQLQDAQLAIERSVMNRIFKLAFYPNQDGDILRDQWVLLCWVPVLDCAGICPLALCFRRAVRGTCCLIIREVHVLTIFTHQNYNFEKGAVPCFWGCGESGQRAHRMLRPLWKPCRVLRLSSSSLPSSCSLTLQVLTQVSLSWENFSRASRPVHLSWAPATVAVLHLFDFQPGPADIWGQMVL